MIAATPLTNPGIYLESSGSIGMSGTNTDPTLSGPWFMERQWLEITYSRSPIFASSVDGYGLSSMDMALGAVGSRLLCHVFALYQHFKTEGQYQTSSWTQPQTFEWLPNSLDRYGNNTGAVGPSALGAWGTIKTKNIWVHRRPWNDYTDIDATLEVANGTNFYGKWFNALIGQNGDMQFITGEGGPNGDGEWPDVEGPFGFGAGAPSNIEKYTFGTQPYGLDKKYSVVSDPTLYPIAGHFDTTKESPRSIQELVDQCGNLAANTQLYRSNDKKIYVGEPPPTESGAVGYSSSRHSWI